MSAQLLLGVESCDGEGLIERLTQAKSLYTGVKLEELQDALQERWAAVQKRVGDTIPCGPGDLILYSSKPLDDWFTSRVVVNEVRGCILLTTDAKTGERRTFIVSPESVIKIVRPL